MADINNSIDIAKQFLAKWEQKRNNAYWDSNGQVWTIGYGNTYYEDGSKVESGDSISDQEADSLLQSVVNEKDKAIRASFPFNKMDDNQYAAMLSIAYNAGQGNLLKSSIPSLINRGADDQTVADTIKTTLITSKGKVVNGLVRRRADEADLYLGRTNIVLSFYRRNPIASMAILGGAVILLSVSAYYGYKLFAK